jgi:hypothetical protein
MNTYKRNGNKWTINELLALQREYELLEWSVGQIAEKHFRTVKAILYKLVSEGFINSLNEARGFNSQKYQTKSTININQNINLVIDINDCDTETETDTESDCETDSDYNYESDSDYNYETDSDYDCETNSDYHTEPVSNDVNDVNDYVDKVYKLTERVEKLERNIDEHGSMIKKIFDSLVSLSKTYWM